jgi:hypothetical protein
MRDVVRGAHAAEEPAVATVEEAAPLSAREQRLARADDGEEMEDQHDDGAEDDAPEGVTDDAPAAEAVGAKRSGRSDGEGAAAEDAPEPKRLQSPRHAGGETPAPTDEGTAGHYGLTEEDLVDYEKSDGEQD